jgi:hypothetical protein
MASWSSQRHSVAPLISATKPRSMTARRISASEKRDKGLPWSLGSSQASALTSTTTLGGKTRRGAATSSLFESNQARLMEALPPLADDLTRSIESRSDEVIGEAGSSIQDDLGANHISIR